MGKSIAAAALATCLMALVGEQTTAAEPVRDPPQCFLSRDWAGWKASADASALYIHVQPNRYYRLDFAAACPALRDPGVRLITRQTGPWICHPMDLDLMITDSHGFVMPCTVMNVTPMSAPEVKALPRAVQP